MSSPTRTAAGVAALSVIVAAALACTPSTRADSTGIDGQVDAMIELRLEALSESRVAATVTTTVARTRLSTSGRGITTTSDDFAGPVTGKRVVIQTSSAARAAAPTITLGPQGP